VVQRAPAGLRIVHEHLPRRRSAALALGESGEPSLPANGRSMLDLRPSMWCRVASGSASHAARMSANWVWPPIGATLRA
jgi:hypothetical protein